MGHLQLEFLNLLLELLVLLLELLLELLVLLVLFFNLFLLLFFSSFFSVFSELYEFASKYFAGYQFDSSGFDTWMDIMANMAGAFLGYLLIWLRKYATKKTQA